jgi:hypothetical protein
MTDVGALIMRTLKDARAAKITASIGIDVIADSIDDDTDSDGCTLTITVMVDGFGNHHGDDIYTAAYDLECRVAEAIADRSKA